MTDHAGISAGTRPDSAGRLRAGLARLLLAAMIAAALLGGLWLWHRWGALVALEGMATFCL